MVVFLCMFVVVGVFMGFLLGLFFFFRCLFFVWGWGCCDCFVSFVYRIY